MKLHCAFIGIATFKQIHQLEQHHSSPFEKIKMFAITTASRKQIFIRHHLHRHCVSLLRVRNTNTAAAALAQSKLYSLSQQHNSYHHYHQTQRRCKSTLSSSAIEEIIIINPKLVTIINHDINLNEKNKIHNSSHRVNIEDLSSIPLSDVRNFCIVAHVDHGKSSLASRMLERTGNLGREEQLLAINASTRAGSEAGMNKSDTADIAVSIPESATSITNKKEQIQHLDACRGTRTWHHRHIHGCQYALPLPCHQSYPSVQHG
mmetsp:Transcript_50444/g.60694  ORF Transcript_50444/g.60694 Transcript_50444/m.60694 type:complete len:262 (+) Transcript_50444:380-1165(+)